MKVIKMSNYVVENSFIDSSKYKVKSPYNMTPEYITVHNTANDAPAVNEIKYMKGNNNTVSYHVAIDDTKAIVAIPFNRTAWHCGDGMGKGNMKSIGIEICYSKSGGSKYTKAEENAVDYIAKLLKQYGWGIEKVKKHQDWSGKYCPHRILSENRWASFISRISTRLAELKGTTVTTPKPPASTSTSTGTLGLVTILAKELNYYDSPRWSNPVGVVTKGQVFTAVAKVAVDGAYQYKLKSGTYITASEKYVKLK